jgi:hypothetical protein
MVKFQLQITACFQVPCKAQEVASEKVGMDPAPVNSWVSSFILQAANYIDLISYS